MLSFLRKRQPVDGEATPGATTFVMRRYDRPLLAVTLVLMGIGVVMVYSASIVSAEARMGDSAYYLRRQLIYVGVALFALFVGLKVHHDLLRRLALPGLALGVGLLVLVLVPGVSASAKGAARWIGLGPIRFQPSEAIKLAWIIFLAQLLSQDQDRVHEFKTAWLKPTLFLVVIAGLLMMQPDFGSTMICSGMMGLMVFTAGARWLHVSVLGFVGAGLALLAVSSSTYRMKRLAAFMSPEDDPLGVSYHINQALISFGSGEWTGLGLGGSTQKAMYLPEAHTDFIFSILGEELGLLGVGVVILCFVFFIWRGFGIARRATTSFGALLAFGITAEIGFQAATNMAVATAVLPTKGLTLPFISFGGSSLVLLGLAVGILLNISQQNPPPSWVHRVGRPSKKTGANRTTGRARTTVLEAV